MRCDNCKIRQAIRGLTMFDSKICSVCLMDVDSDNPYLETYESGSSAEGNDSGPGVKGSGDESGDGAK